MPSNFATTKCKSGQQHVSGLLRSPIIHESGARPVGGKVVRSPDLPRRIFMRTRRSSARRNLGGRMRAQSPLCATSSG